MWCHKHADIYTAQAHKTRGRETSRVYALIHTYFDPNQLTRARGPPGTLRPLPGSMGADLFQSMGLKSEHGTEEARRQIRA